MLASAQRLAPAGRDVVVIQDTSELSLGGRRAKANGYGPIGKGGALRGLLLHTVLAVDSKTGAVIGLVDAKVRNREGGKVKSRRLRKTAQKERNVGSTGQRALVRSWRRPTASPAFPIGKATFMSTSPDATPTCI